MQYKELFLKEFEKLDKEDTWVIVPIGTLEWHGSHLPLGTDAILARCLCEILSKKIKSVVLPTLYFGTCTKEGDFIGMERKVNHYLKGCIYYMDHDFFLEFLQKVVRNIKKQGFKKIMVFSGHIGTKQTETLGRLEQNEKIKVFHPKNLLDDPGHHAGDIETSILYYLRPDLIEKSKQQPENEDMVKLMGCDPRDKASKELGEKLVNKMIDNILEDIKNA